MRLEAADDAVGRNLGWCLDNHVHAVGADLQTTQPDAQQVGLLLDQPDQALCRRPDQYRPGAHRPPHEMINQRQVTKSCIWKASIYSISADRAVCKPAWRLTSRRGGYRLLLIR